LPQGSTLEDWPLTYDELAPYYERVEEEVGVSGLAGNLGGKLTGVGNPFEAPRAKECPMPPLRGSGFTDRMAETARQLGWHPFAPPAAINSKERNGRSGCVYHGYCATGGCHVSAKNSTAVSTIPEAVKTKNLTIFDKAHVTRIEVGPDGRASGVRYIRNRQEYFQPAKVVLLGGYTYENTRLLLLSKSKAFPKGLSNNHGQVGRHYFGHWTTGVTALFPFDINVWYGLPAQGVSCDDWADDNFDHAGLGFIGGVNLHVYTERHPIDAGAMPTFGKAPTWGTAWKKFIKQNASRMPNTYMQTNTFPYETLYLDLDDSVKDPLGDPVCRVNTGGVRANEQRAAMYAQDKMEQWFRAAGAVEIIKPTPGPPGVSTHAYGGTRMGDNPDTNVVDRWCFSHEVPNLGVLGASVMGTSGSRNPTLTVQALAWRTAEHLAQNWNLIAR
jgi:gluconate 2-dehydrogenase alpha chain